MAAFTRKGRKKGRGTTLASHGKPANYKRQPSYKAARVSGGSKSTVK